MLLHSPHVPKGLSTKLHKVWSGPYYFVEIGPNHTFQLRHCVIHKPLTALVHENRLNNYDGAQDCDNYDGAQDCDNYDGAQDCDNYDDAQDRNNAPVQDSQNDVNHDLFKLPDSGLRMGNNV